MISYRSVVGDAVLCVGVVGNVLIILVTVFVASKVVDLGVVVGIIGSQTQLWLLLVKPAQWACGSVKHLNK